MKRVILSEEFIRDVSIELEDSVHYCEKCGAADPVSGFDVSAMWREHFASPNAGKVSRTDFEAAVIAGTNKAAGFDVWPWMTDAAKDEKREGLRAALSALGLEVE